MLAMHADLTLGDYVRLGLVVAFLCLACLRVAMGVWQR